MFPGFAKLRIFLTSAAFLRRISRELHRMNDLAELRLSIEHPERYKTYRSSGRVGSTTPQPRMVGITRPSVSDWNENYNQQHPRLDDEDDVFNHS